MTHTLLHIIAGFLLLLVPLAALYLLDRNLLRTFVLAVVKMMIQVLAVCLMVWALIRCNSVWMNIVWFVLVSIFSAVVTVRRVKLPLSQYLMPVAGGYTVSVFGVGVYLLYAVLPVSQVMNPRWFVPLMALLMGHTMIMTIMGLSAYHSALKTDEHQYEFLRGNGTSHLLAVKPFVRRALQAVLSPTAANLSMMGRFTMPLLLCGIFIAGVTPINAFVMTLILTISCVAASVIALFVVLWLSDSRIFDKFGKLR